MPGAAGLFELDGYGEEEFFFIRTRDELDIDGKAFGGSAHRQTKSGETREIEPLAEAHGFAVVVWIVGAVVARAVLECRRGGNCGEQNRDFSELSEERGAHQIAVHAGFLERSERNFRFGERHVEISSKHWAEF